MKFVAGASLEVFVNAFKEQQAQIERQQREIDELKAVVCIFKPDAVVCKETKR